MKRLQNNILRLVLVILTGLLALPMARAQEGNWVYAGQSSSLMVVPEDGVTYTWSLYNDVTSINFATDPGNCPASQAYFVGGDNVGDSVEVMWVIPGTYFFMCMANDSCTNNLKVGIMAVLVSESEAIFLEPGGICPGDTATLTLEITGCPGPWDVTYTDGTNVWVIEDITESPHSFQLIPSPTAAGDYHYWVTEVTNSCGLTNTTPSDPVTLTVHPKPNTSPIYIYNMSQK